MPLLDIRNLTIEMDMAEGRVKAVDRVSLTINEGKVRGLIGESGSGKSLIGKAIVGISKPNWRITADRLRLGDIDLMNLSERERRRVMREDIAMIFQDPATCLDPSEEVGTQLEKSIPTDNFKGGFWRRFQWRKKQAQALLHKVGIKDHRHVMQSYPYELSQGVCQQVMIAMAIAGKPKLLIADEPSASMDPNTASQILKLLKRLNQTNNMTILLVSNDFATVRELAQDVSIIYCGQIVEVAQTKEIISRAFHPYTQALLDALPEQRRQSAAKTPMKNLAGSVPLLQHLPIGCRLGPRCPHAQKQCVEQPVLQKKRSHLFACHFPLKQE
ncbi:ATP-binding cassette domain-containing protein [Alginatibacterium sediminis]|uniref:ATP-binding cassette domain-containing protein n=1 Tax=Alginatibacterium sediminis TaxID=2164068 RepID=A0A420EGM3_9ALTE|nr:oligopeptide/dipeptide ABC transporter ATP-binding protein [Alginatibacterium sediminis]RKF19814.1 ATP-binding cassette domain-containing protein [Alginatibacterium sediminis]